MKPIHTLQPSLLLLRRTPLLPGESLVSLLERLAQLNYYPSPLTLDHICRQRLKPPANKDDLARPKWAETFLQLSDLTKISPDGLYAASIHRFAPCLTLPQHPPVEIPWIGATSKAMLPTNLAQAHLRFTLAAQYCPQCLKTAAYHHLIWTPVSAAICLEHHCLLVRRCPQCQKRISIQEIVRQRCRVCQMDLSAVESISVEGDELGIQSQQLIQSCLAGADVTELPGMGSLPSRHPAVIYYFLQNLSRRLLICWKDWPALPTPLDGLADHIAAPIHTSLTLPPEWIFYLQRAAFACATNWPQGIFHFLDAFSGNYSSNSTDTSREKRLKQIRQDWFQPAWKSSEFEFTQQCFVDYLLTRGLPLLRFLAVRLQNTEWFIERTGLWSEERTARFLELSIQSLRRMTLKNCLWPQSISAFPLFEHSKILSLHQKWQSGWSLSEASQWLGLHPSVVGKLVDAGFFTKVNEPASTSHDPVLDRYSVEDFFRQVACQLTPYLKNHQALINLEKAANILSTLGIDQVDLLRGVLLGSLPAYKPQLILPHLGDLCFLRKTLFSLSALILSQRGLITDCQFAREKKKPYLLIFAWIQKLSIEPEFAHWPHQYYDQQLLEHHWANGAPV
jgi:hypothetical protein